MSQKQEKEQHIQSKNILNLSTQIEVDQSQTVLLQKNNQIIQDQDNTQNVRISQIKTKNIEKKQDNSNRSTLVLEKELTDKELKESLAFCPRLTKSTKIFIPFLTFFTISIFIFNKLFHGATLQFDIVIAGFTSERIDVSYFELLSSVQNMWDAGVYPLAILIFAFSGIWPYVKLIGMVFCWYLPLKYLSFQKREKFLVILDIMGKWSLIDSYFMIIMICAFRFQIDGYLLEKVSIELNLAVTPGLTYYLFITGTMLSLVLTHLVLYQHRKSIQTSKKDKKQLIRQSIIRNSMLEDQELDAKILDSNIKDDSKEINQNLLNRQQEENVSEIGSLSRHSNKKERLISIFIIFGIIILVIGFFLEVFTFEFGGLAGWALRENYETHYSLVGLVDKLPQKTFQPDSFGIRYIQILFVVFVFVVPLLFQSFIFILYKIPLKLETQRHLFVTAEILYSWSSLEVFIIAMISSVFQIRQFAQYMVGSKCAGINQIIKYLHEQDPEKYNFKLGDSCFELQTQIEWGIFGIIVASICYCLQGSFVLRSMQKKLEQQEALNGDIYLLKNQKQKKNK